MFITVFTSAAIFPVLSYKHSVHNFPPYFSKINFNIILPATPSLPSGLFLPGFQTKILHAILMSPVQATCPSYAIFLDCISLIIFGEA
jgi:hypothetical protein